MPLELSQIHQLASGQRHSVVLAEMPSKIAMAFGCHPGIIYMGARELTKLLAKHSLSFAAVQNIPFGIKEGQWFLDDRRQDCAVLIYYSREDRELYYASIKKVGPGNELWLQTCHRTTRAKADRRIKKLKPLK